MQRAGGRWFRGVLWVSVNSQEMTGPHRSLWSLLHIEKADRNALAGCEVLAEKGHAGSSNGMSEYTEDSVYVICEDFLFQECMFNSSTVHKIRLMVFYHLSLKISKPINLSKLS